MSSKTFHDAEIGSILVQRRKGSRSIKLSLLHSGGVRVSQPWWLPYTAGHEFALSKRAWIIQNSLLPQVSLIRDGQMFGKNMYVSFIYDTSIENPRARQQGDEVIVRLPAGMNCDDDLVQKTAQGALLRALKKQAEALLAPRLQDLATQFAFDYSSLSFRKLSGRWGSCTSKKHITLNVYLLELPWEFIDYVLIHELVHTKHLNHSKAFWDEFLRCEPRAQELRRSMKAFKPIIGAGKQA